MFYFEWLLIGLAARQFWFVWLSQVIGSPETPGADHFQFFRSWLGRRHWLIQYALTCSVCLSFSIATVLAAIYFTGPPLRWLVWVGALSGVLMLFDATLRTLYITGDLLNTKQRMYAIELHVRVENMKAAEEARQAAIEHQKKLLESGDKDTMIQRVAAAKGLNGR